MPLADTTPLVEALLRFMDSTRADFEGFPLTVNAVGEAWGDAFSAWLSTAVVPPGLGEVLDVGGMRDAMLAFAEPHPTLEGVLYFPPGSVTPAMTAGLAALVAPAATLPFATTPPVTPFIMPVLPLTNDSASAAAAIATVASAWVVTGLYIPPPGTAPAVPWS